MSEQRKADFAAQDRLFKRLGIPNALPDMTRAHLTRALKQIGDSPADTPLRSLAIRLLGDARLEVFRLLAETENA